MVVNLFRPDVLCSSPENKRRRLDQQKPDYRTQVGVFTSVILWHLHTVIQIYLMQMFGACGVCICQSSAEVGCDEISTLERKLLDVMNNICDLLGSVSVDEWLSVPSSLAANIQRLLLQRFLVSFVAPCMK